jgi:hypothetical protein
MGAKILWNLVSSKSSWRKEVLWKKYFLGKCIRCLECRPKVLKGSPILTLCLRSLDHFNSKLTWIPGNGKCIRIWEDSILGESSLDHQGGLSNIKSWLHSINLLTLWDISKLEENEAGNWKEWDLGNYPINT